MEEDVTQEKAGCYARKEPKKAKKIRKVIPMARKKGRRKKKR